MKSRRKLISLPFLLILLIALSAEATAQTHSVEEVLAALGKGPTLGKETAAVTIVEFSDFQCSFCKRFWAETLPRLKESYFKRGQAQFIHRHFAILGKHSMEAAKGAECAGEQGKFWEYHDKLFSNQGGWAFTAGRLKQYARELGLKPHTFSQCLDSGKYLKRIEGETTVAAFLGARGTPTFFINGRLVPGAQPFEVFRSAIDQALQKNSSKKR